MKIALLTDGIFPYVIGGMQRHSYYLARFLAAQGVTVDLYHTVPGNKKITPAENFSADELKQINFIQVPFPERGKFPGHYIRESYEFSRRLYAAYKKRDAVDFIYAKGFTAWEFLNRKSKGEKLPPVGVNFHGYEMFQFQPSFISSLQARLLRSPVLFSMKHADYLFSYGKKITTIIESLGVDRKRIIEIPTGIATEWINDGELKINRPRRFIFSGRYERRKAVKELSEVIASLRSRGEDFEFHFVGAIPDGKKLRLPFVTYHGEIRDSGKMRELLRRMDISVCPSFSEGMPNVVMEAMASGLSVIATDTGATSAMVDAENGWLIPPGNKEKLHRAIVEAIDADDADLLAKKKNSVKKVKEEFTWEHIATQTISEIAARI